MRDETVARNYAETLFALAERHEGVEVYGDAIQTVAALVDENPDVRLFLETPRVADEEKKEVVRRAFGDSLPKAARAVSRSITTGACPPLVANPPSLSRSSRHPDSQSTVPVVVSAMESRPP